MEQRKVGITGGCGRIGSVLANAFKDQYDVTVFDISIPKEKDPKLHYKQLDFSDKIKGIQNFRNVVKFEKAPLRESIH